MVSGTSISECVFLEGDFVFFRTLFARGRFHGKGTLFTGRKFHGVKRVREYDGVVEGEREPERERTPPPRGTYNFCIQD